MARDTDYIEIKVVHLCQDGVHSLSAVHHISLQEYDYFIADEDAMRWAVHCLRRQIEEQISLRKFTAFNPMI